MKTAIIYSSTHHQNTKKLLDAIKEKYPEVALIDCHETSEFDLSDYDRIGFASGITYGKLYPELLEFMESNIPENKEVFFIYTCGSKRKGYTDAAAEIAKRKNSIILGEYGCLGFDTYGPFKLIGGISKGHPDKNDIDAAISFFEGL
ncbi:MAG: flavodoxin family protein [Oscillospiraceae bacterium]|nr:flavodoxin family protein [Oscillospiraceae bacterium]